MAYDLILVGGTGQRIGLMLGYLNVLGLAEPPSNTIVVDADQPEMGRLERLLTFGDPGARVVYVSPLGPGAGGANQIAARVEGVAKQMGRLCIEPEDAILPVDHGFFARPQLASIVYYASMTPGPGNHRVAEGLVNHLNTPVGGLVVVAGSVAGGTGAGLIPSIAREVAHGGRRVVGLVFTRCFQLPPTNLPEGQAEAAGRATDEMAEANARAGTQHLLNLLQRGESCPFSAVYMLGHCPGVAVPQASRMEELRLHHWPGFLLGGQLLADGGASIQARIDASAKAQGAPRPELYLYPCGENGEVRETQIPVLVPERQPTHAGALRQSLGNAKQQVQTLATTGFESIASGVLNLFVKSRMSHPIYESLVDPTSKKMSISKLRDLDQHFREALATHAEVADEIRQWWADTKPFGLVEVDEPSGAVVNTDWRNGVKGLTMTDVRCMAQQWVRQVSAAQLQPRVDDRAQELAGAKYLLPQLCNQARAATPCEPLRVGWAQVQNDRWLETQWLRARRSYARPDAPAEAFGVAVRGQEPMAVQVAFRMWQAVAAGLYKIKPVDVEPMQPREFDKVAAFGTSRRFLLLVTAASRPAHDTAVGGIDSQWGIWPGVDTLRALGLGGFNAALESELGKPAQEFHAIQPNRVLTKMDRASLILELWASEVMTTLGDQGTPPWLVALHRQAQESVRGLAQDVLGQLRLILRDHVRTAGPILAGRDPNGMTRWVYALQFEHWRKAMKHMLCDGLVAGRLGLQPGQVGQAGQDVMEAQQLVARLRVGVPGAPVDQQIQAGRGDLDFVGRLTLVMDARPNVGHGLAAACNLEPAFQQQFIGAVDGPTAFRPDVLWT